jgi:hypothetical protein
VAEPGTWRPCPARTRLTTGEQVALATVPNAAHLPQRTVRCMLEARHPGTHMAMAQSYGRPFPHEHWLTWGGGARQFATYPQAAMCTTEFSVPGSEWDSEVCPLPSGHPGGCSPPFVPPERVVARLGRLGGEVPDGAA